jgi:DNA replication protein DnaC
MQAAPDRLTEMLTRLKLTAVRDQLDGLLDEAGREELSLRETLVLLCEREIARKDERRIEMTLKLARFPFVRDLVGFDLAAQPSIDPKQVRELAGARWAYQRCVAQAVQQRFGGFIAEAEEQQSPPPISPFLRCSMRD